ncbi:MAG TPA: LrgB family protein [Thiolinea sp.]|nr:LrgB family protein [Thiolinea sp.]
MKQNELLEIWVYLSTSPLLGLTVTLLAYVLAYRVYLRCHASPLANPVALAVALLISLLVLTKTPYKDYFDGAKFVHFLLGPATVALAIPLYKQMPTIKRVFIPLLLSLIIGVLVGAVTAIYIAKLLGASKTTLLSLAPKSVTSPVAMSIAEHIGGLPSLTAALVVSTGIIGAVFGPSLLKLMNIQDPSVMGVALGVTAHGVGTSRAFQLSAQAGAFAGLSMALSALANSIMLPWLVSWLPF